MKYRHNAPHLKVLQKTISRDLAVFSMQLWTLGYLQIKEVFNEGYTIALGKKTHGTFFIYRCKKERQKTLKAFLQKFKDEPTEYYSIIQNSRQTIKEIKKSISGHLTSKDIVKIKRLYVQSWPGVIANYYIPDLVAKSIKSLSGQQKKALEYNNRIRAETEGFYDEVQRVLCQYAQHLFPMLSKEQILLLTFEELLTQKCPNLQELKDRTKAIVLNGKVYTQQEGEKVIQRLGYIFEAEKSDRTIKLITGQTAYKGEVRGIVRLIFNKREINQVKVGDILVSPMTTPDFLPAMKQAAAFVTDEGGTLCHAAIVAREMKKPCVIGTKNATTILKTGDLVKVNATKGTIKRLS